MTQFDTYRWEDHVPRPGGWKLNLALSVLAFTMLAAAVPDGPAQQIAGTYPGTRAEPVTPARAVQHSVVNASRDLQAKPQLAQEGLPAQCPFAES